MDEISLKPQLREPLSQSSRARGQNLVKPAGVGRGMIGGGWTAGDGREGGRWEARDADGRPRAGRGAPIRRSAGRPPADRTISGGRLRPVLPHVEPPPGRRGRGPGGVRPRPAVDRGIRRDPAAPPLAAGDRRQSLPDGAGPPGASAACVVAADRGSARPAARPGRHRRPGRRAGAGSSGDSGPNIAWSSRCTTSRISPTRRSPRPSRRPVGTVKTWLHRARAQLAEELSTRGVHC